MEAGMSIVLNDSGHWQLPDGSELWAGDRVDILMNDRWIPGEVYYHPKCEFQIRLENGQSFEISTADTIRITNCHHQKDSGKMDKVPSS
jgi:hypothetical protein